MLCGGGLVAARLRGHQCAAGVAAAAATAAVVSRAATPTRAHGGVPTTPDITEWVDQFLTNGEATMEVLESVRPSPRTGGGRHTPADRDPLFEAVFTGQWQGEQIRAAVAKDCLGGTANCGEAALRALEVSRHRRSPTRHSRPTSAPSRRKR